MEGTVLRVKTFASILVLASLVVMSGCASTPGNSTHQSPSHLLEIILSATSQTIPVGGTSTLTANGTDQYGNPFSFTPSFKVSGTAITLSGATVTGASQGTASVTATAYGVESAPIMF